MRTALIAACVAGMIHAQEFEVASVKPAAANSERGSDGGPGSKDPTHYTYGKAGLKILIMIAYNVEDFQVSSKVPLDRDEFDIVANVAAGATREQFRIMLRMLLEQRFNLKAHIESKEFPAYELVVAKGGSKLQPASSPVPRTPATWLQDGFPDMAPDRPGFAANHSRAPNGEMLVRAKGQQQTLWQIASWMRSSAEQPVVDRTGLTGKFHFFLEFTRSMPGASTETANDSPGASDLKTALEQQLGLQLVKRKLPFDVVVVDSIDRMPTAN